MKNRFADGGFECGCDEAGRGCLAGPVFAAAVILPDDFRHPLLNDSKQLTERQRALLRPVIEREAIDWAVESVTAEEIDRINILNASFLAMTRAVRRLGRLPDRLLIDGNRFRSTLDIPCHCIIKGDAAYTAIAAASILAKTYRDDYMESLAVRHPQYNWHQNKGYPTADHRRAILTRGLTLHHRLSFNHAGSDPTLF
ncbi:MAG: ribonuclease HII [Rikenellaceae bacterium]|nr:ribonuclease HII [Rikenellaceae bacterium]